jgi:uncharacterized membrane protein YbhN (UPF0104 family)
VRWYRISVVNGERTQAFTVLLSERILDNYCWLILLCAALASLSFRGIVSFGVAVATSFIIGVVTVAGWLVLMMMRNEKFTKMGNPEQLRFVPRGISVHIRNIVGTIRNNLVSPRQLAQIAGLSLALNVIFQVVVYSILIAFVPDLAFDQYLLVINLVDILGQLPITIAGIGLNETVCGYALPLLGMDGISALSVGMAGSTLNIIWGLIGGGFELVGLGRYHKPTGVKIDRP